MVMYRFENRSVAHLDMFGELSGPSTMVINLIEFKIVKETKCGCWINVYGDKKFVNTNAKKQYASRTKEKAKECFIARKTRYISILSANIRKSEDAIYEIELKY